MLETKFLSDIDKISDEQRSTPLEKTINYVKTTNDPLKNHVAPHPAVGEITAYQACAFSGACGQARSTIRGSQIKS